MDLEEIFDVQEHCSKISESIEFLSNHQKLTKIYKPVVSYTEEKNGSSILTQLQKEIFAYPSIEFRNVCIEQNGIKLLNHISFQIQPYEKIAIVGESGSGKSTIFNALLGMLQLKSGDILINGMSVKDIGIDNVRQNMAIIPQSPYLFNRSIGDNLIYNTSQTHLKYIPQDYIQEVIKLSCSNFIYSKPKKLNFVVGKNGEKLSGGERQRLSIARAFLKIKFNSNFLIGDEITASLDNITDSIINRSVKVLTKNATTILITHRLSSI